MNLPKINHVKLDSGKKAIVVSDLHLGYKRADTAAISHFLDTHDWTNVDLFILLGDIFDFWRKQNVDALLAEQGNEVILDKILTRSPKVIFVRGNHDYSLENLAARFYREDPSRTFEIMNALTLESEGKTFFLTHGYELEVFSSSYLEPLGLEAYELFAESMCRAENKTGGIASWIWDFLTGIHRGAKSLEKKFEKLRDPPEDRAEELSKVRKLAESNAKNILLGLAKEDILVFGHSHKPFENQAKKVVNTGSWMEEATHHYVEITNGTFTLVPPV